MKVSKEAREAAAEYLISRGLCHEKHRADIKVGQWDADFSVKAFARFEAETMERAATWVMDGYRCRTCGAVFIGAERHPQPECARPDWDKLTEDQTVTALRTAKDKP